MLGQDTPEARLGRDAALTAGSSVLATAIAAVTSVLVARYLGVAARGEWAVIGSLAILIATLVSLGLPTAAAYGIAQTAGGERLGLLGAAVRASFLLAALAVAVYCLVVVAFRPAGAAEVTLLLGAAIVAGSLINQVVHQVLLTAVPLRWFAIVQQVPAVLMLVGTIAIHAVAGLTVTAVVVLSAIGTFSAASVGLRALFPVRLITGRTATPWVGAIAALRPYVGFAVITFAITSLGQVVQRTDVLIVDAFDGTRAAGLYAVAMQFGTLLLVLPGGIGFLLFRRGAIATPGHWDDALRALRWMAAAGLAGALTLALAGPWLIDVLVGARYGDAVGALRWLLPGMVLLGLQSLISSYLAGRGRPRAVLFAWLAGAVAQVGLNLVVVPAYGFEGAAVVASFSYVVVLGMHLRPFLALRPSVRART